MESTPRRSFLQVALASIGLVVAGSSGRGRTAVAEGHPPAAGSSRREAAIVALRVVNTLQARHAKAGGGYLTLQELMQLDSTEQFVAKMAPIHPRDVASAGRLLPGFATTFEVSRDRSAYTLVLRDLSTTTTYKTDASGVIEEGTTDVAADRFIQMSASSAVASFRGAPILPRGRQARKTTTLLGSIVAFFLPTLHAQGEQCCGLCMGGCTSSCGECTSPLRCCNLGYQVCTWCCGTIEDCSCLYFC
jgi:hypothetical protein